MPFIAECQYCKSNIRAADNSMGMSVTCPRCGNCFTLAPMRNPPPLTKPTQKSYRKPVADPYGQTEEPAKKPAVKKKPVATIAMSAQSEATETNATLRTSEDEPALIEQETTIPVPCDEDDGESPFARPPRFHFPLSKIGALAFFCGSVALVLARFHPLVHIAILPLAGVGLLLGVIGYVVEANSEKRLILLPAVGSIVSTAVLLIAGFFPSWIGIDRQQKDPELEVYATKQMAVPLRGDSTSAPRALDDGTWVDASAGAVQQNDLRLHVMAVAVDYPQLKVGGKQIRHKEKLLLIHLRMNNIGAARKIPYTSWNTNVPGSEKLTPILTDNQGKTLARKGCGPDVEVIGQTFRADIFPGRYVEDVLLFEAPPAAVDYLRLELPLAACDAQASCRLQISRSMIHRNETVVK